MEKLKQYKYIILIVLVVLGFFYWSEYRPRAIKKECYEIAVERAIEKADRYGDDNFYKDDYDTFYKLCLQRKGL